MTLPSAPMAYRIMKLRSGRFGVEVTTADGRPAKVTSFETEAAAQAWIDRHKEVLENKSESPRRWRLRPFEGGK
jgi:hypothetical protein